MSARVVELADVYARMNEEPDGAWLAIGVEATDDDEGMSMQVGPFRAGTTVEDLSAVGDGIAVMRGQVLAQYRQMLAEGAASYIEDAIANAPHGSRVEFVLGDAEDDEL